MPSIDLIDAAGALAPLGQATSLPREYYVDPAQFERERDTVWSNSWVSVARVEDLEQPGSFLAVVIGGDPVVVTRDDNGELNAFANVCPHRGTVIAEGSGTARALQCPYHNWSFRLDGALIAAPGMADVAAFQPSEICLIPFAVETWQGWVFVNISGDAPPLGPQLGSLTDRVGPYELSALRRRATTTHEIPVNWKLLVENFAESYHHAAVHPKTLHRDFPGHRSWLVDNDDGPWTWLDHVSTNEAIEPFAVVLAFPAHMFSINRGFGMDWIRLEALTVNSTRVHYELFFPPTDTDNQQIVDALNDFSAAVNGEDMDILGRVQAGLSSRWSSPGPVSPLEEGCWQFRRWLVKHSQTTPAEGTDA